MAAIVGVPDIKGLVEKVQKLIDTLGSVFGFLKDPFDYTAKKLQDGASGLAEKVLPALTHALQPDLTADWVMKSYKISFAIGVMLLVLLLILQLVRGARGTIAPRDLVDSITIQAPAVVISSSFGPMLGVLLVKFFGAMSDSFIAWGVNSSATKTTETLTKTIKGYDISGTAGGAIVAIILLLGMLVGLLMTIIVLLVQLVAVYFGWVCIPIALAWLVDNRQSKFALKLPTIVIGLMAAHPLLFFLLGTGFNFMASVGTELNDKNFKGLESLVNLVVALLAIWIAALSPILLFKFAPVIPGLPGQGGRTQAGPDIGSKNSREANERVSDRSSDSSESDSGEADDASSGESADTETSGVMRSAADKAGKQSGGQNPMADSGRTAADVSGEDGARGMVKPKTGGEGGSTGGAPGGSAGGAPSPASAGAGSSASKAMPKGGAGATGGAGSAGGAGGAAGGAAAGEAGGAEAVGAAGAAESGTGVGAVVGVPTLVAAAGMAAVGKGVDVGTNMLEEGANEAVDAVDGDSRNHRRNG